MALEVIFEWTVEEIDGDGEIENVDFADTLDELSIPDDCEYRIGLVFRRGSDKHGELDRYYAYVVDGEIPYHFSTSDGYYTDIEIPRKYRKEFEKWASSSSPN